MSGATDSFVFKIILLGNERVGKTSIRRRYMGEKFKNNYIRTIGADFSYKQITHEGELVQFSIWDLSGQHSGDFKILHPLYYRGSLGAIFVYDCLLEESYDAIPKWLSKLMLYVDTPHIPVFIVANKIDLCEDRAAVKQKLQQLVDSVLTEYDHAFSVTGMVTSAKTGEAIEALFTAVATNIIARLNEKPDES